MKYAVLAIVMVLMAGILHMLFVGFDYALHNEESGAMNVLTDKMNDTLDTETQNRAYNQSMKLKQFFGIGRVACIALVPVLFIVEAVSKPKIQQ